MKKILIPTIALMIIVLSAFTAKADWVQNGSDYYYYNGNNVVANQIIDDEYYTDSNGKMVTNQWVQVTENNVARYHYFGSNGKMIKNRWYNIGDKTYHFDDNGYMETGWILDNMYFCHYDDGHMLTGWQRLEDPLDYQNSTQQTPNVGDDSNIHWYYFSNSGKKYQAEGEDDFVEKRIDGKRYCFNNYGALQTGWVKLYDDVDGIGAYKYYDQDGTDHVGWYSLNPPEGLESNYAFDVMWFYFNTNGTPQYDEDGIPTIGDLKKIDKKRYYFNLWGTPVWGLCKLWTDVDGSDYETYFFGTQDQCYSQSGKFQITEGDAVKSDFYFVESGPGYTGTVSNSLYYKGKLQKAESVEKYAVINVGGYNYLVNTSGKIQKNKSCKDSDGVKWESDSYGIAVLKDGVVYTGNGRAPEGPVFD